MNTTQKFALERDAFERQALGLPAREFKTERERAEFAKELIAREETVRRRRSSDK